MECDTRNDWRRVDVIRLCGYGRTSKLFSWERRELALILFCRDNESKPELEEELQGHTDWVRDVAWAPNIGLPGEYIATASQVSCFSQDRSLLLNPKYRTEP